MAPHTHMKLSTQKMITENNKMGNFKNTAVPSAAYILTGLCSFICPGLGQLLLNRLFGALILFASWVVLLILGLNVIFNAHDTIEYFLGGMICFLPHLYSAYLGANGHRFSLFQKLMSSV